MSNTTNEISSYEAGKSYRINKDYRLYYDEGNSWVGYTLNWDGCKKEFYESDWIESEREKIYSQLYKNNCQISEELMNDMMDDVISTLNIHNIIRTAEDDIEEDENTKNVIYDSMYEHYNSLSNTDTDINQSNWNIEELFGANDIEDNEENTEYAKSIISEIINSINH